MSQQSESLTDSDIGDEKFGKLLQFSDDFVPVLEDLEGERKERRLLDFIRNLNVVRQLNSTNEKLDVDTRERVESDVLLEKLNSTRLDTIQRNLLSQIKRGFDVLHDDLAQAKERMRVATEKLYQDEVDYDLGRQQLRNTTQSRMDCITTELLALSQSRLDNDGAVRNELPPAALGINRGLQDEHDIRTSVQADFRERLLPLEHSDINDVESSLAQKAIRMELRELFEGVQAETVSRIAEERAQAARTRALTDALRRGLSLVNRKFPAP